MTTVEEMGGNLASFHLSVCTNMNKPICLSLDTTDIMDTMPFVFKYAYCLLSSAQLVLF